MFIGRHSELDSIHKHLLAERSSAESKMVFAVHGLFGSGKTTLLRKIRGQVESEKLADAIFSTDEDIATTTLAEFVFDLANSYQSLNARFPRFSIRETDANRRRYLQIIGKLGVDTMPILQYMRNERLAGEQMTNDVLSLEFAIKNQFNNPDDQRLILDTSNVLAESLIVDMINTFFPVSNTIPTIGYYLKTGEAPKKIVFVIDTYEKISNLVNPWFLESLLPFVYQKRFGDFHNFRLPYLPDASHVRDFLDVRFMIAGRERLLLTDLERRWDRYREQMLEIKLGPFTLGELREYLGQYAITDEAEIARVMKQTQGLPYLVALWVDATKAHEEGSEHAFVNALAEQRIFWYKTPQQEEWIRAAAFLDWFDADALRCFTPIGEHAEEAFEYLRTSSEVAAPSTGKGGKFEVHPIIRSALRESTFQQSEERSLEFQESAAAFYNASSLFSRFDVGQRQILRRLSYYNRFDDYALEQLFGGEVHRARELLTVAPDLFERHTYTHSMTSEPLQKLQRYNRCAERMVYQSRLDEAKGLWQKRRADLTKKIDDCWDQIGKAEEFLRQYGVERQKSTDLQHHTKQELNELRGELRVAKRRQDWFLSDKEVLIARASFFLLALFLIGVFASDSLPVSDDSKSVIRTVSLVLSIFFIGIFALMLGRILYNRSRRKEQKELREDVTTVEVKLRDRAYEYYELVAEGESASVEIMALQDQITQLTELIKEYEGRLKEPYI